MRSNHGANETLDFDGMNKIDLGRHHVRRARRGCSAVRWLVLFLVSGIFAAAEPLVVAFGDSVTAPREGFVVYAKLLANELKFEGRRVRVSNKGIGGHTTAMGMARFEKDVVTANPDVVAIMFGINDAAVDVWKTPPATESRVSLANYRQNLAAMIRTLKEQGVRVVLMTSNPVHWNEKTKIMYGHPPYDPDAVDGFNGLLRVYVAAAREIAEIEDVGLVDVFAAFESHDANAGTGAGALTPDGMHPGNAGQRLIADLLIAHLRSVDARFE